MSEAASLLLEIRDLTVAFETTCGPVRAVEGMRLAVRPGRTLAVVGESGSGKTVTALSVMGLLPTPPARIESGVILYRGRDLRTLTPPEMRAMRGPEIGMIFQEPRASLNPVVSVGALLVETIVRHGERSRRAARRRALSLLEAVELPDPPRVFKAYPHQCSGGMCQRAMIALALAGDPALLVADEPTTALDVTTQGQILALLRRQQQARGLAIMLITHDLGVVAEMAHEVCVLFKGRVVEYASVDRILTAPVHPYTRALLQAVPRLEMPRGRLPTVPLALPASEPKIGGRCPWWPNEEDYELTELTRDHWCGVTAARPHSARMASSTSSA